ncbi:MAG: biosynthetic-type acetolactate synthase large subunit [Treponema sp.]|nr:biosynthetic-type acetolactate synthase large subunit [Treponema sp.]
MKYTGAQILIESLIKNGVDTVFGYPGGAVLNIYDELYKYKDRIKHVLVSHEQHAAHAADGYARSSGRVGVCLVTSGPGATNLVTGIATAFVDSVPIIAITGNVGLPLLGKDSFQEVDIAGITMPIVKHNWIVKDVRDLAEIVNEAFIVAQSGRPGPVLIDIPKDVSAAVCGYDNGSQTNKSRYYKFKDDDINNVISLIKNSKRPMLYVGGGAVRSGANEEVKKLAETLGAPVALSLMGMGAFPADHPLCTGLIGKHGTITSGKAVQKCDLLITLGARFSDRVTGNNESFAKNAKIVHIDIDPAEINKNIHADAFIIGDLKEVLTKLEKHLPAKIVNEWGSDIAVLKAAAQKKSGRKAVLNPGFVVRETARLLGGTAGSIAGGSAIVVTDVGQHQIWTALYFPFKNGQKFLTSGGMGTMGYGMGAAAGAKIANPKTPVVLFTGDGSFRMNCAEMSTMVKYNLPVLIIVFNNHTLGLLRQWQKKSYKSIYFETDLEKSSPDFVKLADAYNVTAFRVYNEKSFTIALQAAVKLLNSGKPVLIEAAIDKNEK